MCGFAGCWSNASADLVSPLALRLRHRGPDGGGVYASPDRNVAFGHRRLAIVDLGGGDQPMANEDGTVWIGFNGEIYNHQDLRGDLERAGHQYRTNSDTETLIHAYEEYGEEFLTRLNGEFSLILYDEKRGAALVARDRLGIRPLFYAEHEGRMYFASEIKALLEIPGFSPEVNPEALDQYLSLRYSSGEQSMLAGVRRLPPGSSLRLDVAGAAPRTFWRLPTEQRAIPLEEAAERLDSLLAESVRLRLMSDVPLGMYLSGGVDSAVILALMARQTGQAVRTFSIGFGLPLDETEIAAGLARQFGAQHTEIRLPSNAYEALPDVVAGLDEPLGDIITLPTYFLSRAAAPHVKVVLTGEGADEIFGSYVHHYALTRYSQYRQWCPRPLRKLAPAVVDRMPMAVMNRLFPYPDSLGEAGRRRVSTFLRQAEAGRAYLSLVELFNREQKTELLSAEWRTQARWESNYDSSAWPDSRYLESVIDVDCRFWLPDYTLFKQDRLTMANSIEGRVPFLDHRLVEFVLSLPPSLKMRNGKLKYLLRHVASRHIGPARAFAKKAAFYLPIRKFFGADFDSFVRDTMSQSSVRQDGYFNPAVVDRLVDAGLSDGLLESKRLIALLMFTLWLRGRRSHRSGAAPMHQLGLAARVGR
jgi:asparagine synthase (glutamine-hydrolysing)